MAAAEKMFTLVEQSFLSHYHHLSARAYHAAPFMAKMLRFFITLLMKQRQEQHVLMNLHLLP